jgi:DNA polymerase-3 subunit delta
MKLRKKDLRRDIDRDRLRPVYLLHGPDEFLKERAVQEILQKVVPPELKEFNLDVLYGDETDAATIVDRAASLPMMAERRVVLVRNVNDLPADERRKILEYSAPSEKRRLLGQLEKELADPGKELRGRRDELLEKKRDILEELDFAFSHVCLVLTADEKDVARLFHRGRRKGKTPASDEPWLNTFADRIVAGVSFPSPRERDIPGRVRQLVSAHGKTITPAAVDLLSKAVGNDLLALNNELNKLSIFIADRNEIQADDVEMVVGEMKTRSIWDLCDAVLSGRTAQAFSLLGRLAESGLAAPQLTGALRWRLHRQVPGRGAGRAGGKPKIPGERLEKAFGLLYETELSVNTGSQRPRIAMTLLIDRLCRLFQSTRR